MFTRNAILPRLVCLLSLCFVLSSCDYFKKNGHFWAEWWTPGDTVDDTGYQPDQPIPQFSHKIHAGDNKIPCQYCHSSARRSITAGIPPLNTCMGCHRLVKTESEPIKKITSMYDNNEPIHWTKVHDLPDFVRFTHKRHVQSGIDCSVCHGNVAEMTTATQVASLKMGWCVDCHNKNNAPTSCQTCHF